MLSAAIAGGWSLSGSGQFGWHGEAGVESKLIGAGFCRAGLPGVRFTAGIAAGLLQNAGVSAYALQADARLYARAGSHLQIWAAALVQHEQWNDWQSGENRAAALARLQLGSRVELGVGIAYRAQVFDPARYASPFWWRSPQPECNLLYDARWRFLQGRNWGVTCFVSNLGLLSMRNPQQFPFGLEADWRVNDHWTVYGRLGAAVNGVSAPLLSVSEFDFAVGVTHAP